MAIIEFKKVNKSFGSQVILRDVSCEIEEGKTTVIIGPSGTGKSVFLKLLVGLLKPDSGEILVYGRDITKMSETELYEVRKKLGMLFQDGALFDSLNVGENVAFPLKQHTKKSQLEIDKIVSQKLLQVGLPGVQPKFPPELSGGMRKRVGFARAIVMNPQIVLFDEPHSGLDPVMSDAIDKLILKMKKELGSTFVVISHDIAGTFQIADYIGMLYQSRLIAFGPKEEIINSDDPVLKQFFSRSCEGPMEKRYVTGELDLNKYVTGELKD